MSVHSIIKAEVLDHINIKITFDDGTQKIVDFSPFIGEGMSSKLNDPDFFKKARTRDGYLYWENSIDFCPEFLYRYVPKPAMAN